MLPEPLDMLIAHKAINLTTELSGLEKCVAAALIDSFNRKTAQCDPSLARIARLFGIDRRTVIRTVKKLDVLHFVRKVRHGGKFNRNSYAPNWIRFREIEAAWKARFRKTRWHSDVTKESSSQGQPCHVGGDETVTQTFLINPSLEPSSIVSLSKEDKTSNEPTDLKGHTRKKINKSDEDNFVSAVPGSRSTRPIEAALAMAERRWNTDLHDRFAATPTVYGEIVDAIDRPMQSAATEAELRRRGAGLAHILDQLRTRNIPPIDS